MSYYFYDRTANPLVEQEAWALGGWLAYESGWLLNRLKIGATVYTTQRLYGPPDRDGTLLLASGQRGFTVLGQAYVVGRIVDKLRVKVYRQTLNLPFINKHDNRMVPNTFEAFVLNGRSICKTDFIIGHVTKTKGRNLNDFDYMSEVGGAPNTKKGLTLAGIRYNFTKRSNIGACVQYGWDLYNTIYAEAKSDWQLGDKWGLALAGQYIDQRSVGKQLVGNFITHAWGVSGHLSYRGAVFTSAFTSTGLGSATLNPYGGHPGFTSVIVQNFNRAGENGFLMGLSYDFSRLGLPGLSAFSRFVIGITPDSGRAASPNQNEIDVTVDFRPPKGRLKGLWLRFRSAWVNQYGPKGRNQVNLQAILNYHLPAL
jgi:hypothetical protein